MDFTQIMSSLLGIGVASGLNLYAVVLTVGLAQRLGWLQGLPEGLSVLSHPAILGLAAALYLAEFVADKIPGFTPLWDGVHTFIRPVGAAVLALSAVGDVDPVLKGAAMIMAGSLALGSHATKMGTRLAAHAVPDPVTHSAISMAEDVTVVGLILLAYTYPWVALPVLGLMVLGIALMLPYLFRVLRFFWNTLRGRVLSFAPRKSANGLRCYIRSGKGLGRLREAWIAGNSLEVGGWWGSKKVQIESKGRHAEGLFLDFVEFTTSEGKPVSVYLTKDWAGSYREAM